ncbi:hypothetical protein [Campylobacter sp. RM16704]|uniref:hypothetical protein n=1 Tax=Campylobacter sp. RM16704 TaxID=1500960 RepID=UPI00057EAEEC|nr:hypothetical protein [Campylobacter sp. RM16704]AJC86870.1 hypothetical protein CAQ16704_1425 [Campylobacter sp. RM16704]
MDSWKKLEDLNLLEVQKKTQIELACLEFIVKKDFKSISRFNVNGFIKILQREYELDFTSFLEEYHAYLDENGTEKKNHMHISPRVNSYTRESSNIWFIVVIIIVVFLIALAWGISKFFQNSIIDENITSVLNQEQVVSEEKTNKNEVLNFFVDDFSSTDENNETNASVETLVSSDENNIDLNETSENNITFNNLKDDITLVNESIIKPNAELWLGIVDLKTFRKSSMTIKNDYVLSLDKDMLITTGHAAFILNDENNNTLEFKSGVSKFLMIKDGKIKQITKTEFIKENRGKLW